MEPSFRKRLILGQVSISIVIMLSTAAAFIALGSTARQAERTKEIDRRLDVLGRIHDDARSLARSARRYLLTGDFKEQQRVYALEDEMKTLRDRIAKPRGDQSTALDRSLDEYTTAVIFAMSNNRDDLAKTIAHFEDELARVRNQLGTTLEDVIARERAQVDASHSTERFTRGARWALLFAAVLGVSLSLGSLLSMLRLLSTLAARKRASEEIAERVARARRELLAASTELRSPLDDIIEYCADLRSHEASNSTVAAIETSATRVARLLVDVLDVSGLQAGTVTLFRQSCDAATLVERAIKHHRSTALDRGIRLGFEARLALNVSADRERIEHVLTTLLGLAIAAARVGAHIAVSAEAINDGVRFAIVDSAVSSVPAMFEPIAVAPTDELAMQLCHRVIEAHGGRFGVGAAGAGRTYWFTLPTEPSVLK